MLLYCLCSLLNSVLKHELMVLLYSFSKLESDFRTPGFIRGSRITVWECRGLYLPPAHLQLRVNIQMVNTPNEIESLFIMKMNCFEL